MFETPLAKPSRSLLTGLQHINRRLRRESFRRTARSVHTLAPRRKPGRVGPHLSDASRVMRESARSDVQFCALVIHDRLCFGLTRPARLQFRQAANRLGWTLEPHSVGCLGPNGEDLTVNVALSKNGNRKRTLVISSEVHGVEGFFGSAVQLALLEQWATHGAPSVTCVFQHGLNPYGFSWLRRFDENNIDPTGSELVHSKHVTSKESPVTRDIASCAGVCRFAAGLDDRDAGRLTLEARFLRNYDFSF